MPLIRDCYTIQQARAYMVHLPEAPSPVVVLASERETITIEAALVHPITKKVYSRETLELFSPVTLVQSSNPVWYFIISRGKCSCGLKDCVHMEGAA